MNAETVPSGVPQGSAAASVVAEMVMGQVLRDVGVLPEALLLISYSDNLGVLVPSRTAALAVQEALRRVFETHRLGRFSVRTEIDDCRIGFDYLGCRWRAEGGSTFVEPISSRREAWEYRLLVRTSEAEYHRDVEGLARLWLSIATYCETFTEWDDPAAFQDRLEATVGHALIRAMARQVSGLHRTISPETAAFR